MQTIPDPGENTGGDEPTDPPPSEPELPTEPETPSDPGTGGSSGSGDTGGHTQPDPGDTGGTAPEPEPEPDPVISHSYSSWSETGRNSTEKETISGSTRTVKVTTVIDYRRLVKQYKDGSLDDQWYEYDSDSSTLTKDYKWVSTDWVMTSYDGASSVLSGAARQDYENDFGQMTIYDATGDQPKSTLVRPDEGGEFSTHEEPETPEEIVDEIADNLANRPLDEVFPRDWCLLGAVFDGYDCGLPVVGLTISSSASMVGAKGVQTASKTLWKKALGRLDVENPAPGKRAGQLHFQEWGKNGGKWLFNGKEFPDAPKWVNDLLQDSEFLAAVQKGWEQYLGMK